MGKEMKETTDTFLEVERQLTHILHVEMKPTFQYRLKRWTLVGYLIETVPGVLGVCKLDCYSLTPYNRFKIAIRSRGAGVHD